jgi:hypothetical protein
MQEVHLLPGQFVFGRKKASEDTGLTEQQIRTALDSLRKKQNLTIKTTNKFSVISIVNWETYQGNDLENNQQINQPVTSKQPASNHKQERKKEKNKPYTVDFNIFYKAYPKKKAPDAAWRAWQKRNGDRPSLEELLKAIERQKSSNDWKKDGGQYIPHPATWLNQGRWADEVQIEEQPFIDPIEQERIQKLENRRNGLS